MPNRACRGAHINALLALYDELAALENESDLTTDDAS